MTAITASSSNSSVGPLNVASSTAARLVVADEQVGGAERVVVERARGRHAEVVQAEAARVLDGRAHPAVVDADHAYNLRTSSAL